MANYKIVQVAVGVLENAQNEVLIARRPAHLHQGGLWEFPGGKVEAGETVFAALVRELKEEVGVVVHQASPLLRIDHDYGDKKVCLQVRYSRQFSGEARGLEGQQLLWVKRSALREYDVPAANNAIIQTLLS